MKPTYNGFEAKRTSNFSTLPPAGAYVAEIQGVKTEPSYDRTRDVIVLMLEITEGEYAGQYHKVYEDQRESFGDSVKYKGTLRLTPYIPGDASWIKSRFEENLWCIEQSNAGYQWDWDEAKLKGKKVGINVRNRVYYGNDGKKRETTEIAQLETVADVKDGKCRILKDRVQEAPAGSNASADNYSDVSNTVDVPF